MKIWVKNTEGKPDAILTVSLLGFAVVILKLLLSGLSISVAGGTYAFGEIDAGQIAAMLTPTLGAYVSRRYTDRKYSYREEYSEVSEGREEEEQVD
jgi:hypothetical protein